jgi:bifunctional non-homologous end joining protein LigD
MKAKLVDSMPSGEWIYEIKFDGYRAIALRGGSENRILSRNQKDLGSKFPEVKDSVATLDVQDVIIDYAASGIMQIFRVPEYSELSVRADGRR